MSKFAGSMSFGRHRGIRRRVSVAVVSIIAVFVLLHIGRGKHSLSFSSHILADKHGITFPLGFSPSKSFLLRANPEAKHTYLPNGHLEVNPDGPHPILELIRDAEDKWRIKNERASRTLEEAVSEYKRRYERSPPKGFDLWWNYAIENNVQLPDEYDFIYHDLEPFWGVPPEDLLKAQSEQEEQRNLLRGLDEILSLLKPVEEYLPSFRAIFSPPDNPNLLSNYETKKEYAKEGRYVDVDRLSEILSNHYGLASACPPAKYIDNAGQGRTS